jgi:hypothetical protein
MSELLLKLSDLIELRCKEYEPESEEEALKQLDASKLEIQKNGDKWEVILND